jgi:hypothetical protein
MMPYRERLLPATSMYFYVALVIPASILVFLPIGPQGGVSGLVIGIVTGLVLYTGVIALFVLTAPRVEVTTDTLRVGRARIPRSLVGQVRGYDGEDATHQRGPGLDARAFLCIRGWVKPVVRITIADPNDPTPYWLVSTRHPNILAPLLDTPSTATAPHHITQGERP